MIQVSNVFGRFGELDDVIKTEDHAAYVVYKRLIDARRAKQLMDLQEYVDL